MDVGKDEAFALPVPDALARCPCQMPLPDARARCQMPKFLSHGVG